MIDLSLDATQVAAIYKNGNFETREIVKKALGDKFSTVLPVTERIKTFEDACAELGDNHPLRDEYRNVRYSYTTCGPDLLAYAQIRIIVAALNEGWEPQFTEDEYHYFPCYRLYTKEEVDGMTEEQKEEIGLVLWGGSANSGSLAGLACAVSRYAFSSSYSSYGARLAFKTRELAEYAGKQFIDIFLNFFLIPTKKEDKE